MYPEILHWLSKKTMRAPFQILILPYRKSGNNFEFAIFKRADAGYWQGIAGGGEDNETPLEAAKRELLEETGINSGSKLIKLQFLAYVPKTEFAAHNTWSEDIYVIPEHYYAIEIMNENIVLSHEHTEYRWVDYDKGNELLYWQSNKVGLWELNERLKK